jgi:hypothetical protein
MNGDHWTFRKKNRNEQKKHRARTSQHMFAASELVGWLSSGWIFILLESRDVHLLLPGCVIHPSIEAMRAVMDHSISLGFTYSSSLLLSETLNASYATATLRFYASGSVSTTYRIMYASGALGCLLAPSAYLNKTKWFVWACIYPKSGAKSNYFEEWYHQPNTR